eukprot:8990926-Pyramimonas_sp.AAC.1
MVLLRPPGASGLYTTRSPNSASSSFQSRPERRCSPVRPSVPRRCRPMQAAAYWGSHFKIGWSSSTFLPSLASSAYLFALPCLLTSRTVTSMPPLLWRSPAG